MLPQAPGVGVQRKAADRFYDEQCGPKTGVSRKAFSTGTNMTMDRK